MLIFIENTPRAYAWGSRDALPDLLGTPPTGEPQAEIWFGDHPGAPASVAKARRTPQSLIELIESDPGLYGVDGKHLPFLTKLLGIGAPLSLQVHPDRAQAEAGFAREEAAGVPLDSPARNYTDPNHKPELLVALSEVRALCGLRPLAEVREDLAAIIDAVDAGAGRAALERAARWCEAGEDRADHHDAASRRRFLEWALGGSDEVTHAVRAIESAVDRLDGLGERAAALRELVATHPGDAGVLVTLLLHLVTLQPGEAVFLGARQLHAYMCGVAIEVMAASDNVLRAGLTEKHIDAAEMLRIVDTSTLDSPRLTPKDVAPGVVEWQPPVPDFRLMLARVGEPNESVRLAEGAHSDHPLHDTPRRAEMVRIDTPYPGVLVVTNGRVRVERTCSEFDEVASVAKGQSLYVSAGEPIELRGHADVFFSTVGVGWARVS